MKRLLVVLILSSSLSYANNSTSPEAGFFNPIGGLGSIWQGTGEILGQTCNFIRNGFTIPGTNPEGILQGIAPFRDITWLCTMSEIYGFVNNKILNGDWQQFGAQMVVQWINDLGSFVVGELGLNNPEGFFDGLLSSLESGYMNFRGDALYALGRYLEAVRNNNNLPPPTIKVPQDKELTAENLYIQSATKPLNDALNRRLQTAQTASTTLKAIDEAEKAEQTRSAIKANADVLKTVGNTTGNVLGTPVQPGIANKLVNEAKSANDLRQVAEIQVEALGELMKLTATYNNALSAQLGEIIKQQAMTNQEMGETTQSVAEAIDEMQTQQEAMLLKFAQEILDANKAIGGQFKTASELLTYASATPDLGNAP